MNLFPHTPKEDEYTPEEAQREQLALLVKAARRCAHDLRHAGDALSVAGTIGNRNEGTLFVRRSTMWLEIFDPVNGPKDYRHRLHAAIAEKDMTIERLLARCKENGIDTNDIVEECPF